MTPTIAPVLQDVAARMSGRPAEQRLTAPDRWAYALRDAVALARPDWVVTHHDLDLEAGALAAAEAGLDDLLDVPLESTAPGGAALELTGTLAALYPDCIVAASVTGPVSTVCRLLARTGEPDDDLGPAVIDCGDVLAALAAEHAARGAGRVIVWDPDADRVDPEALAAAHEPIRRRLALLEVGALAVGPAAIHGAGYPASAAARSGRGAALIGAEAFGGAERLEAALGDAEALAGGDGVVLTDGPVPADCDMTALRRLGERRTALGASGGTR